MSQKFFEERQEQSEIKARIVQKYFETWARIIMPTVKQRGKKIAYIDLFAGPGRYKDGAASTPLLVVSKAIADPDLRNTLVAIFNDKDENNANSLKSELEKLEGIESLRYKPVIQCGEVDEDAASSFNKMKLVPTFSFIDPFGYKGLSLRIIKGVIKDWGCDCIFFFNYNRINAGITNPAVKNHIDALFSQERANYLREKLPGLCPRLREALILEALAAEIKSYGGRYVLPFTFKYPEGNRTSHKLIFVSKSFKGYDVMKSIMASESSTLDQGVPSFDYSPADESMPLLFSLAQPLENLEGSILDFYSGKTTTRDSIYEEHSVDTRYLKKNYNDVLKALEEKEIISISSNKPRRRRGTFPSHVQISFPERNTDGR